MSSVPAAQSWQQVLETGGEMGALIRAFDWASSPLGAVEAWPQSLKTSVSICLNSRFAIVVWWGPSLIKIYNDSYAKVIGGKHPAALGSAGKEVWPEIWDTIGPMLSRVMQQGEASWADDLYLPLERNGYAEECYFTFSYSPIRDEYGVIRGVFTPVVETTEQCIAARRLGTLRDLAAARPGSEPTAAAACRVAAAVLDGNRLDLPCAYIYLFQPDGRAVLQAATANDNGVRSLPSEIDESSPQWAALAASRAGQVSVFSLPSPVFPFLPCSSWGDSLVEAIALPLLDSISAEPIGLVISGVSPRKRLDPEYRAFFQQVASTLSSAVSEALSHERESTLRVEAETERARIRDLFLQAPAAIAILRGADHVFTFANDLYVSVTQRQSASDLLGKPVRQALSELEGQPFFTWLDNVYATGESFLGKEVPAQFTRTESGESIDRWFSFVFQASRDIAGNIDGILIHAVDVTTQVVARREVEEREEQFRTLADSIAQLAWMAHPDGDIYWYNQRWYDYTGTTPQDMEDAGWQTYHDPAILPEVWEKYRTCLESGEPFEMVFPLKGRDGVFRAFLTRALPVRDAAGNIIRWFGTNTDIDKQRKTEEALRQSEKLAAVGRLASSIAHEINNPLEAVTNLIFLARGTTMDAETERYLGQADQELSRVAEIASQTLRFHRQQTAAAPTDIAEVLHSVLALYRGKLSRDEIRLHMDTPAGTPPLTCFASEIRQVLANLVGNALDAMPAGGDLRLRLRATTNWRTGQPSLRVTVSDTGSGLTKEALKRLYEPFFTTKETTGTGLGLWVSAGIVDKHKGRLHVRSLNAGPHRGTTFTLLLPYQTNW